MDVCAHYPHQEVPLHKMTHEYIVRVCTSKQTYLQWKILTALYEIMGY